MRPIKFRLRDRHNKIVGYEKWYTGSWRPDNPDEGFSLDSGWWEASPCWLYSTVGELWTPTFIPHRFKDQYIGLKTKDGTEVYEGDLFFPSKFSTFPAEVYFDERYAEFRGRVNGEMQPDKTYSLRFIALMGIVGNIYED